MTSERAGTFVPQKGGYVAFVPKPLPPPDLDLDESVHSHLDRTRGCTPGLLKIRDLLKPLPIAPVTRESQDGMSLFRSTDLCLPGPLFLPGFESRVQA